MAGYGRAVDGRLRCLPRGAGPRGRGGPPAGGLLALELPRSRAEELLEPYAGRLFVAAVNSGQSTAVSGDAEALSDFLGRCQEQQIRARRLSTPFASHTPLMAELRDELLDRI